MKESNCPGLKKKKKIFGKVCLCRAVFNLSDRLEGKCNVGRLVLMAGSANISKVVDMEA